MKKYFAGIGARDTPQETLYLMARIAAKLEELGWTLRSGGARGADQAFIKGTKKDADVYLPWKNFELAFQINYNQHNYLLPGKDEEAEKSVDLYHPEPGRLTAGARNMMFRNYFQIVGRGEPNSSFVVCWTEGGDNNKGGTGQALRIAQAYSIPIFNLGKEEDLARINNFLK